MERALAVVEATDSAKRVVREAGTLAAGVDADLVLLHVTTEDQYADQRDSMAAIPDREVSYTIDTATEGAKQFARDVAREALDGIDVDTEVVGAVGDPAETILSRADAMGCDHIFIAGKKRSPAGKALFGDVAQAVILDFDGAVTVITD